MAWVLSALLTTAAVMLAILTARRCERAVGGAIAGLPIVSAPVLVGVAVHGGFVAAAQAATASVAACVVLAAFAAGYARAATRTGIAGATGAALCCATIAAPLADLVSARLDLAVALAAVGCTIALLTWPVTGASRVDRRLGFELPIVAASAGVVGASSGSVAAALGGFGSSVFAALPVVGFGTALIEHRSSGAAAAAQCLRGYLASLYGRIAFGLVFAITVVRWGTAGSVVAATVAGCVTTFIVARSVAALDGRTTGCPIAAWVGAVVLRRGPSRRDAGIGARTEC